MILLDACTSFCTTMSATFGPQITEYVFLAAGIGLAWWRARKAINKVEAKADAGIAAANERATVAKAEARKAHVQLAEIRGSLRPAAYTPPLGTSTSESGNFERLVMPEIGEGAPRPRSSLLDPSLSGEDPLPRPSGLPDFDTRKTPLPPRGRP